MPDGSVSAISNVLTVNTPVAGVFDFTATETSTTRIDLAWTPVDTTVPIEIFRSTNGGAFVQLTLPESNTIPTSFSDTDLSPGFQYAYKIRGNDPGNPNGPTGYTIVTTYTLPAPPTNLTAISSDGQNCAFAWASGSGSSTVFEIQAPTAARRISRQSARPIPATLLYRRYDRSRRQLPIPGIGRQHGRRRIESVQRRLVPGNADGPGGQRRVGFGNQLVMDKRSLHRHHHPPSLTGAPGSFTQVGSISDTNTGTYQDTNLSAGTQYFYQVAAASGSTQSAPSTRPTTRPFRRRLRT